MSKVNDWLEQDKLTLLEAWARDGLTNEQIAHNIGINTSTLWDWRKKYPNISDALKKGKEVVDYEVENALLKRALGYTIIVHKQKVTKDGVIVDIEEEMHIAPDTTAQIYWLKNRKPKQWKDKIEVTSDNITEQINNNIQNIANLLNNPQQNRGEDDVQ